jgi:hypothetical protein
MTKPSRVRSVRLDDDDYKALQDLPYRASWHIQEAVRQYLAGKAPKKEIAPKKPKAAKKEIIVPAGINESAWSEWAFFRAHKKKPLSYLSAKKQFKLLLKYSIEVQQNIIDSSINGGWTGLFEPKGNNNENSQSNTAGRPTKREQALNRVERDAAIIASMGSNPCRSDSAGMALDDQNIRQQVGHPVGADDDGGRESYPELRGVVQRD